MKLRQRSEKRRTSGGHGRSMPKRKNQESTIDPRLFVKKAMPLEEANYQSARSIQDLPVEARIIKNLLAKGYTSPTEIQDGAIEPILKGRNLMGIAQTGTGKTGAFLIPIIHNLLDTRPGFQALVIVPTRELAVQVEQEFKSITKGTRLTSACFIGGTSVGRDISILRSPSHLIIGTPGRLVDLARQRALRLKDFKTLVLDEFDRLLDMGFSKDIQHIVGAMTNREQTVLFRLLRSEAKRN